MVRSKSQLTSRWTPSTPSSDAEALWKCVSRGQRTTRPTRLSSFRFLMHSWYNSCRRESRARLAEICVCLLHQRRATWHQSLRGAGAARAIVLVFQKLCSRQVQVLLVTVGVVSGVGQHHVLSASLSHRG